MRYCSGQRSGPDLIRSDWILTYHSPGFIIVEIHQISQFARFLQFFLVGTIDKLLGKADAVPQVVAEIFLVSSDIS